MPQVLLQSKKPKSWFLVQIKVDFKIIINKSRSNYAWHYTLYYEIFSWENRVGFFSFLFFTSMFIQDATLKQIMLQILHTIQIALNIYQMFGQERNTKPLAISQVIYQQIVQKTIWLNILRGSMYIFTIHQHQNSVKV